MSVTFEEILYKKCEEKGIKVVSKYINDVMLLDVDVDTTEHDNNIMLTYLDGIKDVFKVMHEHCRNRHEVQNPDDHKEWQQCCFLLEEGKFDQDKWKCCYDSCPLFNKEK